MDYTQLASAARIQATIQALSARGISAEVVKTAQDAKEKVLSLVPQGAEVMTMSSMTLETTGIVKAMNESGKYNSVKNTLAGMDRATQTREMQKLGAAPEWAVGSVHGVTEDGQVVIASNTGSQLPAYAYGSAHVIWVVGTQKIVKNLDEAMDRLNSYVVPLETERGKKAYSMPDFKTNISKLLIVNKEIVPGRIHIVFVEEILGF